MDAVIFLLVSLFRNLDSRIQNCLGKEQPQQLWRVVVNLYWCAYIQIPSQVTWPVQDVTDWKGDDESSNAIYLVMKSSHFN